MSTTNVPRGPGLFEITRANGERLGRPTSAAWPAPSGPPDPC